MNDSDIILSRSSKIKRTHMIPFKGSSRTKLERDMRKLSREVEMFYIIRVGYVHISIGQNCTIRIYAFS